MEEKKEVKIKLSTGIFLFIIFVLIVALGITYYIGFVANKNANENQEMASNVSTNKEENTEEIKDAKNENVIENNTTDINNEDIAEEEKLIQFDTKFYELEDISKEYRECEKIKNYKDFNYDLDGDGIKDKITIRKEKDKEILESDSDSEQYIDIFELNGKEFTTNYYTLCKIYVVDLNEDDNNLEVVIYDDGPSDDPEYSIYTKKENKMVKLETLYGEPLKSDKKGTLIIKDNYNGVITPEIYFNYYTIENDKMEVKDIDIEEIKDVEFKTPYLYFSKDYKSLKKMREIEGITDTPKSLKKAGIEKLGKDITFKILDFKETTEEELDDGLEIQYKIHVELSDGRKGYIFYIQWAG